MTLAKCDIPIPLTWMNHFSPCMLGCRLATCKLTSACCEDLSSALTSSKTLQSLNLQGNALDHTGVAVLCEALRHPACTLQILG